MTIRKENTPIGPQRAGGGIGITLRGVWIARIAVAAWVASSATLCAAVIDDFNGTEPGWTLWNPPTAPSDPAALAELANHRLRIATKFTTATDSANPVPHLCNVYYSTSLPVQPGKTLELRADLVSANLADNLFSCLVTVDTKGGEYVLMWDRTEVGLFKWSQSEGFSVAFWEAHAGAYIDVVLVLALTPEGDDLLIDAKVMRKSSGTVAFERTVRDTPGSDWGVPEPLPRGWQIFGPDAGAPYKDDLKGVGLGVLHDTDGQQATAIVQFDNIEARSLVPLPEDTFVSVPVDIGGNVLAAEWVDIDNDGWHDLSLFVIQGPYYFTASGSWRIFRNTHDGAFARVWEQAFDQYLDAYTQGFGDYDNDGLPDVAVGHDTQPPFRLYHNVGGGQLEQVWEDPPSSPYFHCEWADLDQDGYLDLVQLSPWGAATVWINDLDGPPFRQPTKSSDPGWTLRNIPQSHYTAWGDYDDDGLLDLYVTCSQTQGMLYRNLGAGQFAATSFRGPAITCLEAEWVDFDGDNDLDLVINPFAFATGVVVYQNDGGGQLVPMTAAEIGDLATDTAENSVVMSWGDFDNDGDLDLYRVAGRVDMPSAVWVPGTGRLYVNLGGGRFARMLAGSPTTGNHIAPGTAGWADFDNDGFLDLIGDKTSETASPVYRNNLPQTGNADHWLKVQCEGRVTNRDAVGAKVRVKASIDGQERWQLRQIGRSWGGVLTAHFGLGDAAKVDMLRVEWPSGVVQEYNDVAVNQSLTIKEPPRLVSTGPTSFEVRCWPGMQFAVEASFDLKTWTGVGSVANVNGTATFSDVAPAEGTCRFYRVVDD